MRKRKLRIWMLEQNRIETGVCLPLHYQGKLCINPGTTYAYYIRGKRDWLAHIVFVRSVIRSRSFLHSKISYKGRKSQ
jgi:hypothetical protein